MVESVLTSAITPLDQESHEMVVGSRIVELARGHGSADVIVGEGGDDAGTPERNPSVVHRVKASPRSKLLATPQSAGEAPASQTKTQTMAIACLVARRTRMLRQAVCLL